MKDFSSGTFKCNGGKYTFVARLLFDDEMDNISLDNNMLECFEYESEFNGLVHYGSITYNDELGKVDKCIGRNNVICQITFVRHE